MSRQDRIQIAIPSYRRADILASRTLPMLFAGGCPPDRVTVFVGTEDEADEYRQALPKELYGEVRVTGQSGALAGQRNAIARSYPVGTRLVQVDDDVKDVLGRINDKRLEPMAELWPFLRTAFDRAALAKCFMWGVYPTANAGFMKPRARVGLAFIIGTLFGTIVRNDPCELVRLKWKEDYERSIRFYIKDSKVLRFEDVALRTSYNNTRGGTEGVRKPEEVAEAVAEMQRKWPHLVHLNPRRKSDLPEITLRDDRPKSKRT